MNDLPNEKPLWINRAGEGVPAAKSYLCKRWQIHPLWKERKQGERVPKESHKGVQIPPNKEQGTRNLVHPLTPLKGGRVFLMFHGFAVSDQKTFNRSEANSSMNEIRGA